MAFRVRMLASKDGTVALAGKYLNATKFFSNRFCSTVVRVIQGIEVFGTPKLQQIRGRPAYILNYRSRPTLFLSARSYRPSIKRSSFVAHGDTIRAFSTGENGGGVLGDLNIPHFDVESAVMEIAKKVEEESERNLYVAHGQYFQHSTAERFIIMNSSLPLYGAGTEDTFNLNTFLDFSIPGTESKLLIDSLKGHSDSPVGTGELDFIDKGDWQCGFCYFPAFSIFTREGKLLSTFTNDVDKKTYLRIYAYGLYDDFSMDEVEAIRVRISDEPWHEQSLEVVLKDNEVINILEKVFPETTDLSLLMVETEWLVKCAGLLCLDVKKKGCLDVRLELPQHLTVAGNPWVEMRHQAWVKSLPNDE